METYHVLNFHDIFSENCFCLSKRLGIDIINDFSPKEGHTYIVFGAHEKAADLLFMQQKLKNFKFIIINSEPPMGQFMKNKYYISLMRTNMVWDYNELSSNYLKELNINVYSRYNFEFVYQPNEAERDIDIFFCGSKTPRREAIHGMLKKTFPDKKIVFHFDWNLTNQAELTRELQRSKYVLNIPFYNHSVLETHRIHKALSCGCKVVSLYSGDKSTDDFYRNYVYLTHDLIDFFNEPEENDKADYPHLINALSHHTKHNLWIIQQLIDLDKE